MRMLALLLLSLATLPALAQEVPDRAGRLAWFEGGVALYQDPERGWDDAFVNSPITSENSVWTDSGARAEVQVAAIALRLDQMSQLDVSRLDDEALDATLEQGALAIRIRHLRDPDVVRISTPLASFRLRAPGRYRLDADPDRGESRMTVFSGTASLETASGAVRIVAGQSVVVWGEDRPAYAFEDAYTTDFDRWAEARDERWVERRAPQYVSYEMTGYEDLDEWGDWRQDPVYGVLWYPNRVEADWAPYRYGHWAYVRPWGWTWIDAQPWGYAPFHYGRWVHVRDRWAWCPGRRVERPVWAPALVAFIGGSGWSAGAASGGPAIGWYPLAPSEPYHPWYRASRTYVNQVNVTVINVPERVAREHRAWNRDRAATVVPRTAFVQQRPVAQARVRVPEQALRSAPSIAAPAVALPTHAEVREAHRERRGPQPGTQATARVPAPGAAPAAAPAAAPPSAPRFSTPHAAPQRAAAGAKPPPAQPTPRGRPALPAATPPAAPPERAPGRTGEKRSPLDRGERPSAQTQGDHRPGAEPPHAAGEAARRNGESGQPGASSREGQQREDNQRAAQDQQRARAAHEAQQREAQQREAQQREAQQRAAQEQQRSQAAREAQQREAQQREAQQRAAQEQQRTQAAREAQQREAQQREAQQREAQQREAQQREAQQRAAQEQQRSQAAREAQQREAQQREAQQREAQQREAQQRAAQEQQRSQAAREAQQREAQQRAVQEQQRSQAAREAQQREAQQRAAHEPPRSQGEREAPKGKGAEKEKEKEKDKEREKNDQGGSR